MDNKNLLNRVGTIFGAFMVFFYLGLAIFVVFSSYLDHVDKPIRVLLGVPLFIYGIYRIFFSYSKIKENFFSNDDE